MKRYSNSRPSLGDAQKFGVGLENAVGENLPVWKRDLTARATILEREITRLAQLEQTWAQTLEQAQSVPPPPTDAAQPTEGVQTEGAQPPLRRRFSSACKTSSPQSDRRASRVEQRRTQILTLQSRVAEQDARINEAVASVKQVREQAVNRLFVKDSPPIWSAEVRSRAGDESIAGQPELFHDTVGGAHAYARRQWAKFHSARGNLAPAGRGALLGAAARACRGSRQSQASKAWRGSFKFPSATALVLSILLSGWIYPQAPRMLSAILGAAALVPTIIILRQLVERHLFPVLNALVVFYFIDQLRTIAAALPLVSRLLFLAEMLGGISLSRLADQIGAAVGSAGGRTQPVMEDHQDRGAHRGRWFS